MSIPQDLRQFLDKPENRHLVLSDGEVRDLTFFAPDKLKLQTLTVDSIELFINGPLKTDPKERRDYEAYSLIKKCKGYSPAGVIAWFPEFNAYGSADTDHARIIIYPGISWTDIIRDPTWYINGQWYRNRVAHQEVNPWL